MAAAIGGTPPWVWLLLAYTVRAGLRATRARTVSPGSIVILPGVFLLLSAQPFLDEIARVSGTALSWLLGLAAGAAAGWAVGHRSGAWREGDLLHVPGSWAVLGASLAIPPSSTGSATCGPRTLPHYANGSSARAF